MPKHVRKGDTVIILSGDDRGQTGRVKRVIPHRDQVIVEGVNVHERHQRRTQQTQQGQIIEKELPVHISNVAPVIDGRATRVRFETRSGGSKVRVAARNGEVIGEETREAQK